MKSEEMSIKEVYRKRKSYSKSETDIDEEIERLENILGISKHNNIYLALGILYNAKFKKNPKECIYSITAEKYFEKFSGEVNG